MACVSTSNLSFKQKKHPKLNFNDLRTLIEFESSRDVYYVIKKEVSEIESLHSTIVKRNSNVSRFINV